MNEVGQKIVTMTLEEFKTWEVPKGWEMLYLAGERRRGWPGSLDWYFEMRIVMEQK